MSAFTLIELLAVIAIITLLLGILIPSLSSARKTAKAGVCLSHLKGIGGAFAFYLEENDDRFVPVRMDSLSASSPPGVFYVNDRHRAAPRWQWFLETDLGPLIDSEPFELIPSPYGEFFFDGNAGPAMQMTGDLFTCPILTDEESSHHVRDGAFGYNYQYLGNTYQEHTPGRWDNFAVGRHLIRNPGKTVMVADSRGAGAQHGVHSYTLDPPRMATEAHALGFGPRPNSFDSSNSPPDYGLGGLALDIYAYSPVEPRHNKRGNVIFADMHGEAMTLIELGYEVGDGSDPKRPDGVPIPVRDPNAGTYTASNAMWNGQGSDQLAEQHKPKTSKP